MKKTHLNVKMFKNFSLENVSNINVKSNIISAMEAVTGLASHKIQVFEMGDE